MKNNIDKAHFFVLCFVLQTFFLVHNSQEFRSIEGWFQIRKLPPLVWAVQYLVNRPLDELKDTTWLQESEEGFPLGSGSTLSKVYELKPLLTNNKDKWGLGKFGQTYLFQARRSGSARIQTF
jgi:hypothetical protein